MKKCASKGSLSSAPEIFKYKKVPLDMGKAHHMGVDLVVSPRAPHLLIIFILAGNLFPLWQSYEAKTHEIEK